MIVTVTPNPSLDRTVEVDALVRGAVLRARTATVEAGGKGVNISQALAANGRHSVAVLPSGGSEGAELAYLLDLPRLKVVLVPIAGSSRANVSIVEPDGTVTKVNEPGPELSPAEVEALMQATVQACAGAAWLAASGSLPPGVAPDFYARLIERLGATNVRIAVDTSGEPLHRAVPAGPDVIKPNRDELSEAAGHAITTLGEAADAAQVLREKGARAVLVSLGPDGALLVEGDHEGDQVVHGEAPVDAPVSTVGAGDSLLAGFLFGGGTGPAALAEGLAWGAAATRLPGSRTPGPQDIDRSAVQIHEQVERLRTLQGGGRG